MQLRCCSEKLNDTDSGHGIVLLEADPQMRSIFIRSQVGAYKRFAFPRILFLIKYIKYNGKFIYPGISQSGLHVFGIDESLKSFDDKIFFLPIEYTKRGLACTDHKSDNKSFNTQQELVDFVITLWWNLNHTIEYNDNDYYESWSCVEDLSKIKWRYGHSLKTQILCNCYSDVTIPETAVLINEKWPASLLEVKKPKPKIKLKIKPVNPNKKLKVKS